MPDPEYLLSYGVAGEFGRFRWRDGQLVRGDRVVATSNRGLELARVMRPAEPAHGRLIGDEYVGTIVRPATPDDLGLELVLRKKAVQVFESSRRLSNSLQLPFEILDVEVLFDRRKAILHYLHWADADPHRLLEQLGDEFGLLLALHDLALPKQEEHEHAEDHPGCGSCSSSSGGCGSCSSGGGGCGSCASQPQTSPRVALL